MNRTEEEQGAKLVRYTLGILLGSAVALGVCFLLLLAASAGISGGRLSQDHMYQITIVCCAISALAGGILAVRRCGARALIVGLLVGVVFFLLLLTVSVVFFQADSPGTGGIGLICGSLLGGAGAGLLAGRGGQPGRRKKRRRPGR